MLGGDVQAGYGVQYRQSRSAVMLACDWLLLHATEVAR
jgi:hypothetical protein